VASGENIQNVVKPFYEIIPVEYYSSEPGQIKQRNKGISFLDNSTKLVATIDDDIKFHKNSISEMIKFWNTTEPETAGVGFNIVNQIGHRHNWARGFLCISVIEPGKVLKNGSITSIVNVKKNTLSQWLCGGATVWRQEILKNNTHKEICSRWAVYEDIIFSYPIGKKFPLYISKDSKIEIDTNFTNSDDIITTIFKSKAETIWGWYFVINNSEMSIFGYVYLKLLQLSGNLIKGIINNKKFFSAVGIIKGLFLLLPRLYSKKSIIEIIENNTN